MLNYKLPDTQKGTEPLVLLVDDEPDLVFGLKATLTRSGFRVATAGDGEQALAVFKGHYEQNGSTVGKHRTVEPLAYTTLGRYLPSISA